MPSMEVQNLSYSFDSKKTDASSHFSVSFPSSGLVSLIGPSGSGKTTLLRMISDELSPTSGKIFPPQSRQLLEVWPTAGEEGTLIDYISRGEGPTDRLRELLQLFDLEAHGAKHLMELSQGELKRAHIARCLMHPPQVLLLDEPFSGPEPQLTFDIQYLLKRIAHRYQLLMIVATQHIWEAMALSDDILVIKDCQLVQRGAPRSIYCRPRNAFVAQLFGPSNLIPGRVVKIENYVQVETPLGRLVCQNNRLQQLQRTVLCNFRPEHLRPSLRHGELHCRIQDLRFWGPTTLCQLDCHGHTLYSSQIPHPSPGMHLSCEFSYGEGIILDDLSPRPSSVFH